MRACVALGLALLAAAPGAWLAAEPATIEIRGRSQKVHLLGSPDGPIAVVSSGDGGWVHLGPRVAGLLAARGYAVVGFDVKHYLSSFTDGSRTLTTRDVPDDYLALVEYARRGARHRVLLVGVSEGAGLSVLAAADSRLAPLIEGVLGLGLPDVNELGWRFADSLTYLTKRIPHEPTFRTADFVPRLGMPLAAIHSTRDEYVPLGEVHALVSLPGGPRRLWVVPADNHRFSNDKGQLERCVDEALEWIHQARR